MKIKKYLSPNRFMDRKGYVPDMIVLHNTGNNRISSAHYWFLDPDSNVSAHYLVGLNGEVRQYVELKDGAFCNGTAQSKSHKSYYGNARSSIVASRPHNCNYYTVAIECVGACGDPLTEEQKVAVAELIRYICGRVKRLYKTSIPLDSEHIIRHCDISPVNKATCGKNIDVEDIIARVRALTIKPPKAPSLPNGSIRKNIIKED